MMRRWSVNAEQKPGLRSASRNAPPSGSSVATPSATAGVSDPLGPVGRWLADDTVSEVLVNGPGPVWVEKNGQLRATTTFVEPYELDVYIEHILAGRGLRLDRLNPVVDARLDDGSRVSVVGPPVAVDGPYLSIRRFARNRLNLGHFGPSHIQVSLERLLAERASLLVVGGTGSGKTSLLNALSGRLPAGERIVCIEDTAELRLAGRHVVRLETRPANSEGTGGISMRQLVTAAMRMRPDRLVVGEVRGAEALDLLLALTAGHDGSLATCHAGDAQGGLRRLALLASLAPEAPPLPVMERFVADAFDAVVHVARVPGSSRREVTAILPVGRSLTSTVSPVGGHYVASAS